MFDLPASSLIPAPMSQRRLPSRGHDLRAWLLGLASVLGSWASITTQVGEVTISFDWAFTFSMVAALGLGLRGAVVAALFGGVWVIPFLLWPGNGWGNVVSGALLVLWVIGQGWVVDGYRRRRQLPLHPMLVQLLWSTAYSVVIVHLYPWLLSLNPAPWCEDSCQQAIPEGVLLSIGLKASFNLFFAALFAWVLLRVRAVRHWFGLPVHSGSDHNGRLVVATLLSFFALHLAATWLPLVVGGSFSNLPLLHRMLSSREAMGLTVFLFAGLLCSWALVTLVEGLRARGIQIQRVAAEQVRLHAELEQARRLEDLAQLAGGVAHDFNNMLAGIFASLETLDSEVPRGTEARDALESIGLAARAARDLTKQLMDASAEAPSHRAAVDIHEAIESAGKMLRRTLPAIVNIEYSLDASDFHCYVDETQFQSAVVNLGINAGHAMPGGGTLRIRTHSVDAGVVIEVSDTGAGIPEDVIARVFEPFFTTRGAAGGTGLGLASVKSFCERSGGRVELISDPGRGTTVRMHLLRATVSQHRIVIRPSPAERVEEERVALVIDDDDLARRGTVRQLRSLGYSTLEAADGVDGTRLFTAEREQIDVVLLDVQMPEMSGPECLGHLRAVDPDVPVLFCTGYVGSQELLAELRATNCPTLNKPFDRGELQDALEDAFGDGAPSSRRSNH